MRADKLDIHLGSLGAPRLITTASGQAGQADFEQHLDEACRAATPVTADSVSALPEPEVLANGLPDKGGVREAKRQKVRYLSDLQHAGTERPPSESGYSGARMLMQSPTHQVGTSGREARRMMLGDEHKYTPAPHPGGGGSMPSEVQRDPPTLVHEGQDRNVALYSTDAATIEDMKKAMREANFTEGTIKKKANALLAFGRWLHKKGKLGFTGRLDTPSLEKDLQDYWGPGSFPVAGAVDNLKTLKAGMPLVPCNRTNPYHDDATLIRELQKAPARGLTKNTTVTYVSNLRKFSHFLSENGKPKFADRIDDKSLDGDVERYKVVCPRIDAAMNHLRGYLSLRAIAGAHPEDAVASVADLQAPQDRLRGRLLQLLDTIGPSGPTASFNVANGSVPDNPTKWGDWLTLGSSDSLRK
ncbi:hypothetical protein [Rhizobium leguminosarum]|uniref:hypothetical protein n=1 Tax=Rhizobium leguminosarum TaxID=384 RepID=UPI0013B7F9B0|nr:hypothetical protein [Rhizobium leguminosarum]NEI67814.1 hypothetical protein [Rhizobium leguminosarum]